MNLQLKRKFLLNDTILSRNLSVDLFNNTFYEELFITDDMFSLLGDSSFKTILSIRVLSVYLDCLFTPIKKIGAYFRVFLESLLQNKAFHLKMYEFQKYHISVSSDKVFVDTVSLLSENVIPLDGVGNDFSDVLQSNYLLVKVFKSVPIIVYKRTESIND